MGISWQELVVVAAALIFGASLLWKFRPRFSAVRTKRRGHPTPDEIRLARERARQATNPRERAIAFIAAAKGAEADPRGLTAAIGLYLRAMRTDPTFCDPIVELGALLRKERPELLEAVLWRRLGHLSWSGGTRDAVRCAAKGLVSLYRHELPRRDRAQALEKVAALLKD